MFRSFDEDYAARVGITLNQKYDAENVSGGMSLIASTRSVTLLRLYVQNMIPLVVAPPLQGEPPTIDLVMGDNIEHVTIAIVQFNETPSAMSSARSEAGRLDHVHQFCQGGPWRAFVHSRFRQ
jgi:hypothetical protein